MQNNDIYKFIRVSLHQKFGLDDDQIMKFFEDGGAIVSKSLIRDFRSSVENKRFKAMTDEQLKAFISGVIQNMTIDNT